jgi:hypothetical protein
MTEHEDEKLSSLMKSLPQQPLPPGFMQRLERRRRAEADGASAPAGAGYLLPLPARVAAFALSCVVVSLVVYDKLPSLRSGSSFVSGAAVENLPSTALSVSDVEQARANGTGRRLLRARGEPFDAGAFAKSAKAQFAARAAAPAAPAASGAAQPTNEELQAGLEREKRRMGVKRLVAPPPPEVAAVLKLRAGIDAQMLKASPPAPELGGAATPALLAQTDSLSGGGAAAAKPLAVEKGAPVAAAALDAAPAAAEGLLLKSAEERAKAWSERGMHAAPPTVDFGVNMVALVVAPDLKTAVEIIGVDTRADRVVVRYRLFPRMAEVASVARSGSSLVRAYQFRVIPRTARPVVFLRAE